MKLYTIFDDNKLLIKGNLDIKKEEYSYNEYLRFLDESKNYYVYMHRYYYETDMSDSDSGDQYDHFSINYNNIIIKDGQFFGVLVKTQLMFPKYKILKLEDKRCSLNLGGGYNIDTYSWALKENETHNDKLIDESLKYIIVIETIFEKEVNKKKEITYYIREIRNLLVKDLIIDENENILGVNYLNHNFIFNDQSSLVYEVSSNRVTLVKIDETFLNKNILDTTYEDYSKKNYQLLEEYLGG